MQLEHEFVVPVPVERAWEVLLDVERVAPCMPGATLETVDADSCTGRVKVKVGPISLTYAGTMRFVSRDEAARVVVLAGEGKETRGSGTARATVRASLTGEGTSTRVAVVTDLAVTGKPAQFGRGVMAEVSGRILDQFAATLGERLTASVEPSVATPLESVATPPEPLVATPLEPPAETTAVAAGIPPSTAAESPPALDLVSVAGPALLRRALPVAGLVGLAVLLVVLRRRRTRLATA